MNLGFLQLSYVDSIGIFLTSCHVSNLAGKILVTDGDSSSF